MRFDVHLYIEPSNAVLQRLDVICQKLDRLIERQNIIMATMTDLQAAVTRETDAENSVVALLEGISQQLKDAKAANDPAALDKVIADIDANTAKMALAVTANTAPAP